MKKSYLLTFLFVFISLNVFAQDADQLNEKSKTLLDQGNYNQSFKTLSQAAELGHPEAQYNLGYSYLEGLGTSKNVEAANQWFLKSAKQDFVDAQFKLAYSYVLGRGVQKDMEKAFTWFSKAAQNGDAESQLLLVGMYIEGNGVEKNIPKALQLAKELAKRKTPVNLLVSGQITSARYNLAQIYLKGMHGVSPDTLESYKWHLITNESKIDFSVLVQQDIVNSIKMIEEKYSDQKIQSLIDETENMFGRKLSNIKNRHETEY